MSMAYLIGMHSSCLKRKVGAVLVLDNRVIATGYNGTDPGENNACEDINGATNPNVTHAEMNLFSFCTEYMIGTDGCDLYVTLAPCAECAREIYQRGIKNVYYSQVSSSFSAGRDILWSHGVQTEAI
jgi:dCMP deaminase